MQCINCNHISDDPEALFCSQCGKPFFKKNHCSGCGKSLLPEDNFCNKCGTAVHAEATDSSQFPSEPISTAHPQRDSAEPSKYGIRESDWVVIGEDEFVMGSPESEKDRFSNEQETKVDVERFEILKTPVTFEMFDIFCDDVGHKKPSDEKWGRENHPVINVSYWSAVEYCHWLSKRTGRKVRLPTEAEWEFACRAGTTTPFSTGDNIDSDQANFDGQYTYNGSKKGVRLGKTTPVGNYSPNPWGLYDMHGNVWEWCASIFDEHYSGYEQKDATDDIEALNERVVRGGSWHNVPSGLRCASRNKIRPDYHYFRIGFRVIREIST